MRMLPITRAMITWARGAFAPEALDRHAGRAPHLPTDCWHVRVRLPTTNHGHVLLHIPRAIATTPDSGTRYLHRLAWAVHHGRDPGRHVIAHRCDDPACVRPAHLEATTQARNVQDAVRRHRRHGALSPADALARARIIATQLLPRYRRACARRGLGHLADPATGLLRGVAAHIARRVGMHDALVLRLARGETHGGIGGPGGPGGPGAAS